MFIKCIMRLSSILFLLCLSNGVHSAAVNFTYDFGFVGSEAGFSGAGSFMISTSQNLSAGAAGLEAFEFSGTCAGHACSFDLTDVTDTGNADWVVDQYSGEISQIGISAYGSLPGGEADTRLFLGWYDEIYLECWDKSSPGTDPCNGSYFDYRAETYPGNETYITLRAEAPVVPIPAAFWLFGSAILGLGFSSRRGF